MADYVIICTVDRLGPKYDGTADVWFGINFSAGMTARNGNEALDAELLKPWNWTLTDVLVSIDGGNATVVPLIDPTVPAKTDVLEKYFDELFTEKQHDTDFFSFSPLVAAAARWPSLLGHLSTSVAPLPHALKLTRFFKLANPGATVHAAPVFTAGGTTYTPDAAAPGNDWAYDAPNVKAVQPGTLVALPAGSMIDLESHWIKAEIAGEEWRSSLEQRIAALFDLGQLLIDVAREVPSNDVMKPPPPLNDTHVVAHREAVLRALHDLAGTGARPRPDGRTLVDDVKVADVKGADVAAVTKALVDYEATVDVTAWRKLLKDNLGPPAEQMAALESSKLSEVATALDALQGALADDATLVKIVRAQWAQALSARADVAEIMARFDAAVPNIRLRDRLALSNLGRFWSAIRSIDVNASDDRVAIRENTIRALHHWYDSRTAPNDLPDAVLRGRLQAIATTTLDEALKIGSIAPTQVPHPLTLQLDRLFDVADTEDFARRIAGAGVLMRRKDGPWRCLNMAGVRERLAVKIDEPVPAAGDPLVDNAVVPYRMQFINDVRQAFVSYNNHPIIARSPAEGLRGPLLLKPDSHKAASSKLQYEPAAPDKANDWNLLPALAFGDQYEVLPFAIGNSGALPKLLAEDANPISLVSSAEFGSRLAADAGVRALVKPFTYKRRVPVGLPRFAKETLPAFPDTVVPLARDSGKIANDVAVLLLASDREETFTVLPPACDINTWDRWVGRAADDTTELRNTRRAVWAEVHRQLPSNRHQNQSVDVSINDPAVEKLRFTLSSGGSVEVTPVPLASSGFASVQTRPIAVSCRRTATGSPAITLVNGGVLITMPRGQFATLTIEPVLHGGAIDRFEVAVAAKLELAIEAVTDQLPTEEELWRALTVVPVAGGKLEVTLKRESDAFAFIKGVEVFRQLWRWDGRPIDPFPFDKVTMPLDDNAAVRRWEAIAFADRRDSDAMTLSVAVNFAAPGGGTKDAKLHTEDRSADPRAHYVRFAIRVRSRYAGIVNRTVSSLHVDETVPRNPTVTQWKRGLILCRPDEVKKPKVKLIVPLTEVARPADASASSAITQKTPGLLVVLNEPWFEVGGLAEQLRIEVSRAVEPRQAPGPGAKTFPEVGTDPIVTAEPLPGTPSFETVLRPIGFTFDSDTEAPLFVRSSFLIDPPAIDTNTESGEGRVLDLSWVFARIRFRRVIDGKGIESAGSPDLVSEPTESHWVQFLPDAGAYLMKGAGEPVATAELTVARSGSLFELRKGSTKVVLLPAALDPLHPAQRLFDLWLLVTQEIVDVVGRQQQEKYVGMYRWDGDDVKPIDRPATLPADARLVVRIIEVQQRPAEPMEPTDTKWWERLFNPPDEHDRDAAGRIVRISPPIRQI